MKVLLVSANTENAPYPVSPLGLCMVATALKEAGHEVLLVDGMEDGGASLPGRLESFLPDLVGVSIRNIDDVVMESPTYYVDRVIEDFIAPIKRWGRAPLVLGGAGFNIFSKRLMVLCEADYGVVGDGEQIFVELLAAMGEGRDPGSVKGVLVRDGDLVKGEPFFADRGPLNTPHADIDRHVDYRPYMGRGSYPIQTKRGCAHRCVYCAYPIVEGASYRVRTAGDVVDEIQSVNARLGDVPFEFVDSTFNDPAYHAEGICEEIIDRKLSVRLRTMGVNPSGVTRRLLELMRKAGFAQIDCTPDSASEIMLGNLRKGFGREKLEETAALIRELSMPTMWFFVLGGPGESEQTLAETFDFIEQHVDERDLVHMTEGLRIYPGTGLFDAAVSEGLLQNDADLLEPFFYVSGLLGAERLRELVKGFAATHYNCLRAVESSPAPEMIREALVMRKRDGLEDEPMFRTLLRIRKARMQP